MYLRVEDWAVELKLAVGVVNRKRNEQIFIFQFLTPLIIALSKIQQIGKGLSLKLSQSRGINLI